MVESIKTNANFHEVLVYVVSFMPNRALNLTALTACAARVPFAGFACSGGRLAWYR